MEIDRVEQKGKGKKGGKDAKGKNKGSKGGGKDSKGKSKGKDGYGSSYNTQKGKGKKGDSGKGKGSWSNDNKGKGKQFASQSPQFHSDIRCYRCDGKGHLAKDCRVRLVQDEVATESPSSSQSSTSASTSTRSSQVTSGQHTATRIARVVEAIPEEPSHVSAVFDMRDNYSSEGSVVRVIQYYIGDSDEDMDVDIRAVVEEIDEHESLDLEEPNSPTTIILDSGADAPIFPASWISAGFKHTQMMDLDVCKMPKEMSFPLWESARWRSS